MHKLLISLSLLIFAGCMMPPQSCNSGASASGGGGGQSASGGQDCLTCAPLTWAAEHGQPDTAYEPESGGLQFLHRGEGSLECGLDGNC